MKVPQLLAWDSEFFARRIARLAVERLDDEVARRALAWCEVHAIDCLYFLGALDPTTVATAERHGFRLVDVRITLTRALTDPVEKGGGAIRAVHPDDVVALREIARVSHRRTRFYRDGNFSPARCDALYETWIDKSCRGWADAVMVAEAEGEVAGYVSCHREDGHRGRIGLFAVAERFQGRQLGQALVTGALGCFADQGVGHVDVVTQGDNVRAQRLYQRCGFVTRSVELWYHRWSST